MADYAAQFPSHPDPRISSDVPFGGSTATQGVFTATTTANPSDVRHYFIDDVVVLEQFHRSRVDLGFNVFYWTPWAAGRENWTKLRPAAPLRQKIIRVDHDDKTVLPEPVDMDIAGGSTKLPPPPFIQHQQRVSFTSNAPSPGAPGAPAPAPSTTTQQQNTNQTQNQNTNQQSSSAPSPAAATAPTAPAPATTDPLQLMMQQMIQSQTLLMQLMAAMNQQAQRPAQPAPQPAQQQPIQSTVVRPALPSWDGDLNTKALWLERIATFKMDPYFSNVTTWQQKEPATEQQSQHLRQELLTPGRLPNTELARLLNVPAFVTDGFKMFHALHQRVNPSSTANKLQAVIDLVALGMAPDDTSGTYMHRVRGIRDRLEKVTIDELLPLFAIANMDKDRYPGLTQRYIMADPALLNATVVSLEEEMTQEEMRLVALGITSDASNLPSANRAGGNQPPAPAPAPTPAPSPAPATFQSTYPPDKSLNWDKMALVGDDTSICPACFWRAEPTNDKLTFHRTKGCPGMARGGFVCKHDPDAAAKLIEEWTSTFPKRPRPDNNAGRGRGPGRGRGGGRGSGGRQPGASRVSTPPGTSSPPEDPSPPPSPPPQVPLTNTEAPPPPTGRNYYDQLLSSSDEEDAAAMDDTFNEVADNS
eukprot:CAMPEP_0183736440 /NCGR_PEP_ID=MMETSP0737-20130205/49280_1 /TAXON_ID=385413 /ORGANISM="Thalassiosira miniscula, Strain CCMP1093" /LENGTH=643 /DNA_ID=CAMNT_0025970447 /DNA_START=56 /DNA_END=1984 /DNA_ORIENTATION=-